MIQTGVNMAVTWEPKDGDKLEELSCLEANKRLLWVLKGGHISTLSNQAEFHATKLEEMITAVEKTLAKFNM